MAAIVLETSTPTPVWAAYKSDEGMFDEMLDLARSERNGCQPTAKALFSMARPRGDEDVTDYTNRIVTYILAQFAYEPGKTKVQSTADEILSVGAGMCQDFAHLTIGVLRLAGIPSRYVSGYLAPALDNAVESVGAQASHAWLEVQLPNAGWTGFDPTNGCQVDHRHIRVAIGRDYSDVPLMRGSTGAPASLKR